jgi:RNA-directed DNA polymerase
MRAKLKAVNDQLRRRMHQSIPEQGRWLAAVVRGHMAYLAAVVRGHMAYYAVPGNYEAVAAFCDQVTR